jgi:uncharacterized protein (DUF1697 family)
MDRYLVLLRGINVGGKNIISMVLLKKCLEELGFLDVSTFIASGNVFLTSKLPTAKTKTIIETALPKAFKLESAIIKVLVLTREQLRGVIDKKPKSFGEQQDKYHSDVIFLMNIDPAEAMSAFNPREGVDKVWKGEGVIYSQRLSSERTKSRLNAIMKSPLYKSMTIRSWNTTVKLLKLF